MSKPTFVFLFTLTCLSALCAAEELNIDVLIRGLNHANRTIQSGEVRALVTDKHYFGQTEKEIEDWIEAERKRELERFKPHPSFPDIGPKEFEEEYLEPLLEFQANSSREYITIYHATSLFRLLSRNSPRLYQYKLTQQEVEGLSLDSQHALRSQNSTFFIFSHDSKKQVKQTIGNAVYPTAPRQSVQFFSTSREHFAFWDFYYLGRSGISVPPETKYIGDETVDGTPCHVLECTSKHKFIHRLWVEISDKHFRVRKTETRESPDGPLMSRYVYKQFEQFGDVWFPKVSEISRYRDGSLRAEFRIEIINAQFNVAFPENFFDIDQDFYYQPRRRGPLPKTLPDSGMSPPATSPTETEALLLLCGPQSLLKVCELLNVQSDISELLSLTGFHPNRGTTMLGLKRAATFKNLAPIGVSANVNVLRWKKVPLPAIAYVDGNHFLVAEGGGSIPFERLHAHDIYANRERTYYQSGLK